MSISRPQARALQYLWLCVVAQALRDIFRTAASRDGCSDQEHAAALAWIGRRDFHQVCAMAGLDGPAVAQRIRQRLQESRDGRFDPGPIFARRGGAPMHGRRLDQPEGAAA